LSNTIAINFGSVLVDVDDVVVAAAAAAGIIL
jgi:hypothetical protein